MARTTFTGVANIVRFNWHYYVIAAFVVCLLAIGVMFISTLNRWLFYIPILAILASTLTSLAVSAYVYDFSRLYSFSWLDSRLVNNRIVNIHAGFDETSQLLRERYPESTLTVYDFYNPAKHTEVSIERARKAIAPYPGTVKISTNTIPLAAKSADAIFLTLTAHEIRDSEERVQFLNQLVKSLAPGGKIIITEHLRDLNNFLAFNVGFFHFFPRTVWLTNFKQANLTVYSEFKVTPFITVFILQAHGTTP